MDLPNLGMTFIRLHECSSWKRGREDKERKGGGIESERVLGNPGNGEPVEVELAQLGRWRQTHSEKIFRVGALSEWRARAFWACCSGP